ncbi:MAG: hypothetical protein K9K21_09680, partial [Desulfotignum sp.]|nr:hypothetical protein [Desulfotignum sp.]
MTTITHKALILASQETIQAVHDILNDLSEIILIHAETTADAMVHIGNRPLAFIVMDLSLPDLDARAVAAGL